MLLPTGSCPQKKPYVWKSGFHSDLGYWVFQKQVRTKSMLNEKSNCCFKPRFLNCFATARRTLSNPFWGNCVHTPYQLVQYHLVIRDDLPQKECLILCIAQISPPSLPIWASWSSFLSDIRHLCMNTIWRVWRNKVSMMTMIVEMVIMMVIMVKMKTITNYPDLGNAPKNYFWGGGHR